MPLIDQLKGFALILVLLYHAGGIFGHQDFLNGQTGVDIFVVVSGFTIALGSIEEDTSVFLRKRFARIFPMYWAALALFIALGYFVYGFVPEVPNVILHVFGLHDFASDRIAFSWAESFWFIGLIVPLYALLFIVRRWIDRLDLLFAVAGAATLAMCLYTRNSGNISLLNHLPMRIPMFFIGVAVGRFAAGKPLRIVPGIWLIIGGLAVCFVIFQQELIPYNGAAALGLIAVWIGFARFASSSVVGVWFLGVVGYFGVISYEVYLLHQPLMRQYNRYLIATLFGHTDPSPSEMFFGMAVVLICLVLLATAGRAIRAGKNTGSKALWAPALSLSALLLAVGLLGATYFRTLR